MKLTDPRSSDRLAFRTLPIDLLVVVAFVLLADALVASASVWPVLRVLVGLPLLFFVPGYVLLAVLYPGDEPDRTPVARSTLASPGDGPTLSTRLALSFGLSVSIIPIYSILLALSPVGFGASTILWALTLHVLVCAAIGSVRRLRLPAEERFALPIGRWVSDLVGFLTGDRTWLGTAVNVLLVAAVFLAASGFAYAVFVPAEDAEYTDYLLLTRSPNGGFVASGYPEDFTRGTGQELVVGVTNHRDRATDYAVVVELQRVRGEGDTLRVLERSELARYGATVGPDETWYHPHVVTPDLAGEDMRLVYFFYRGEAPPEPSRDTADDYLHLWIDVSLPSGQDSPAGAATP